MQSRMTQTNGSPEFPGRFSKFEEQKKFSYEINVLGEEPQLIFRPEWIKEI